MKGDTIQKIDILAASRINLLSARLEEYHIASQKHFQSSINALKEVSNCTVYSLDSDHCGRLLAH